MILVDIDHWKQILLKWYYLSIVQYFNRKSIRLGDSYFNISLQNIPVHEGVKDQYLSFAYLLAEKLIKI